MHPWFAALIILGAAAVSVAGILIVRRHAPAVTFFKDPIPAGAVYTVAGTAYMVIVAFVFFVAFESYGGAKADAEEEATATLAMFHAVGPFRPEAPRSASRAGRLLRARGHLRRVARDARRTWESSGRRAGHGSRRKRRKDPGRGDKQLAAYDHWFALNEERRKGRQGRIAAASPAGAPRHLVDPHPRRGRGDRLGRLLRG